MTENGKKKKKLVSEKQCTTSYRKIQLYYWCLSDSPKSKQTTCKGLKKCMATLLHNFHV